MLIPRDFQRASIRKLLLGHYGLWWRPGVGKTLPLAQAGEETGLQQLWLTLPDLRAQAARVIPTLRRDRCRVQVVGSRRDRIDSKADVVVCSYDMMREPECWSQLYRLQWGSIVCDEAHALKNTGSVRTRAFYGAKQESKGALFRRTPAVWLATGTVMTKDPMDLWPHVSRLWPQFLPEPRTKDGWMNYHCKTVPGDFGPRVIGARQPAELEAMLNTIGEVRELDLDVRLDVDSIHIELSSEERATLRNSVTDAQWGEISALFAEMDGSQDERDDKALAGEMLMLSQARRVLGTVKARQTAQIAETELDGGLEQIIVWGHHREPLQYVAKALEKYGAALMNGDTPKRERDVIVQKFSRGELRALVANMEVGGTGLDGLQRSHRALLMEPDWLPSKNAQAIARQFRQGQAHPVHVSLLVVANSPDEIISRVLERRARMITASTGAAA
jgi:SWI/SNF-related matrix-associated actin-dependent regulator of chromatin subfamily A-like protein 1